MNEYKRQKKGEKMTFLVKNSDFFTKIQEMSTWLKLAQKRTASAQSGSITELKIFSAQAGSTYFEPAQLKTTR